MFSHYPARRAADEHPITDNLRDDDVTPANAGEPVDNHPHGIILFKTSLNIAEGDFDLENGFSKNCSERSGRRQRRRH